MSSTLSPKATWVLSLSTVAPGQSGSITISNDARYAALNGKAVAPESATGFVFDTPMVPIVH